MAVIDFQHWDWHADSNQPNTVFNRQTGVWSMAGGPQHGYKTGGPFDGPFWLNENQSDFMDANGLGGLTTIFFACWLQISGYNQNDDALFMFGEGTAGSGTDHVSLRPVSSGDMAMYRGNMGTEIGSRFSMASWFGNRWNHFACKIVIHDTTGAIVVQFNGDEVANETGLDTRNGGTSGIIDYMRHEGKWSWKYRIAMPIFWSGAGDAPTDFFGPHRIHTLRPDADTSVQFTPQGAGSSYVEVDEDVYDDDTTYNESSTVTNRDKLGVDNLPTTPAIKTIYAVQAKVMATDPDGTATENIQAGVDSGTVSLGTSHALGLDYELWEGAVETVDPNTAAAWTETNVNATDLVYDHA